MGTQRRAWARTAAGLVAGVGLTAAMVIGVGQVALAFEASPASLEFGDVEVGDSKVLSVDLTFTPGTDVIDLGFQQSDPSVTITQQSPGCLVFAPVNCTLTIQFAPTAVGPVAPKLLVTECDFDVCTNSFVQITGVGVAAPPDVVVSEFTDPVDPDMINQAKAGSSIPLKFRVTQDGAPVTNLTTADVAVTSTAGACGSGPSDAVETYAGGSGLQNLGNGYYQYNWKTPKEYKGQCRTLTLTVLAATQTAEFKFK